MFRPRLVVDRRAIKIGASLDPGPGARCRRRLQPPQILQAAVQLVNVVARAAVEPQLPPRVGPGRGVAPRPGGVLGGAFPRRPVNAVEFPVIALDPGPVAAGGVEAPQVVQRFPGDVVIELVAPEKPQPSG